MARTYHDAPITAAQMDKVLSSMNSVSKASNNGKILCVDDFGFLTAKTQQELHIGAVLEPVTIDENGTVTPPDGVDGFDSVTVNVSGPAPVLQNKIVTRNGVVTPDTGYDGLGQVTVDVPSSGYPEPTGTIQITQNGTVNVKDYASAEVSVPTGITAADNGKVVKNGVLVAQTARATDITENGTYDTTENNSVTVNVSGGGSSAVVQPLSVTQNGTYNPPSGVDGYAPVTVNVSGGGGGIIVQPDLPNGYKKLEYLISDTRTTFASMSLALAVGDIIVFKVREAAEGSGVGPVIGQQSWNVNVGAGSIIPYGGYRQEKNDWSQVDGIYTLDSRICFTSAYSGTFWYGAWRGGNYQITANCRLYPLYVLDVDNSSIYSTELKLKAALIPCYRISDGANSFYDTVSDTFLSVSGSFSRGPEVN